MFMSKVTNGSSGILYPVNGSQNWDEMELLLVAKANFPLNSAL